MTHARVFALALVLLGESLFSPAARAQSKGKPPEPPQSYEGFTIDLLAECSAKQSDLKTRHGDREGVVEFEKFLATKGLTSQKYWRAYQLWWERFKADPTGKLEAEFHTKDGEYTRKLMFGDVPDMSQMTKEGVTLDRYAKIVVAMTQPGAKPEDVVRAHGLKDMAHWERVNKAWSDAMGQDTSYRLVTQYGELFQKHAGPAYQKEQQQKLAEMLAENNRKTDAPAAEEERVDLSPDALYARLSSKDRDEKWEAARWLGLKCDEGMVNRKDAAMMKKCAAAVPVLVEILEQHDEESTNRAADAANQLMDMVGGRTDDARTAMAGCLARAQEKLETLRLTFAPIRDKAVPERVFLQTRIQEYESLVGELDRHLKGWKKK